MTLFKYRYEDETREGQQAFLSTQQQQQNPTSSASSESVSPEEKQSLREQLAIASNMSLKVVDEENYIKVRSPHLPVKHDHRADLRFATNQPRCHGQKCPAWSNNGASSFPKA